LLFSQDNIKANSRNPKKNEEKKKLFPISMFSKKSSFEKQGENRVIFQSSLRTSLDKKTVLNY